MITHQLRPESKGSVHINAPDPRKHPSIRFNFLAERVDRDCVLASMRIVRQLVAAPDLAWLGAEELAPGPGVNSDEELLDFVTRTAETTIIRSEHAGWAVTRLLSSMISCVSTGSLACALPTPRSCRL